VYLNIKHTTIYQNPSQGKREVKKVKKLIIFGLALFTVVATTIMMAPVAIAEDGTCYLYYTTDYNDYYVFDISDHPYATMVADAGDTSYEDGCDDAFMACWDEGYMTYEYDDSYVDMCF